VTLTLTYDLLTLKVVSRVKCDMGYLCANFILPRPLCSRVRPDVCDRQTSDKCIIFNATSYYGRGHNMHY